MYTFPLLIKEIRKYSELSQKEFAKTLGVSPVLIAMIETGQKGISNTFFVCEQLTYRKYFFIL
jgi:DNA-binding XRE family transcriptional regulator